MLNVFFFLSFLFTNSYNFEFFQCLDIIFHQWSPVSYLGPWSVWNRWNTGGTAFWAAVFSGLPIQASCAYSTITGSSAFEPSLSGDPVCEVILRYQSPTAHQWFYRQEENAWLHSVNNTGDKTQGLSHERPGHCHQASSLTPTFVLLKCLSPKPLQPIIRNTNYTLTRLLNTLPLLTACTWRKNPFSSCELRTWSPIVDDYQPFHPSPIGLIKKA